MARMARWAEAGLERDIESCCHITGGRTTCRSQRLISGPIPRRHPKTGNGVARIKILTLNSTRHNFRYSIFLMIVVITMINYIDRGAISYAGESITREYGLDRVAWGTVLGYFGYGYMFGALLGGTFADVWGPKRVWLVAGFA